MSWSGVISSNEPKLGVSHPTSPEKKEDLTSRKGPHYLAISQKRKKNGRYRGGKQKLITLFVRLKCRSEVKTKVTRNL